MDDHRPRLTPDLFGPLARDPGLILTVRILKHEQSY